MIYSYVNAISALLTPLFFSPAALSFVVLSFVVLLAMSTTECDHMLDRVNSETPCKGAPLLEMLRSRHFLYSHVPVILRVHI
jgi:hypothetical protein